jgi:hypothetical protein
MSLLWIDGFDTHGADNANVDNTLMYSGYNYANSCKTHAFTRTGEGMSMDIGFANDHGFRFLHDANISVPVIVGIAFYYTNIIHILSIVGFRSGTIGGSEYNHFEVGLNNSGQIIMLHGTHNSVTAAREIILGGDRNVVFQNGWYYMEVEYLAHATAGYCKCRIDGVERLVYTGNTLNTTASDSSFNAMRISPGNSYSLGVGFPTTWVDDMYYLSREGTNFNDYQGDCVVVSRFPNVDVAPNQMTPLSGTAHYAMVNQTFDDDATYLSTLLNAQEEWFGAPNLPSSVITVLGAQVQSLGKKDAASTSGFQTGARISGGGSTLWSPTKTMNTTYQEKSLLLPTKPGGGAWTVADANNIEFGFKTVPV